MRRPIWIVAILLTFLLTTIVLSRPGWLQARSAPTLNLENTNRSETNDPLASDAAWRWQHCQPAHWRSCVLQKQ
jgi:hypothetical protein